MMVQIYNPRIQKAVRGQPGLYSKAFQKTREKEKERKKRKEKEKIRLENIRLPVPLNRSPVSIHSSLQEEVICLQVPLLFLAVLGKLFRGWSRQKCL